MLFKDVKQNYPIYLLDKQDMVFTQGKVVSQPFPRMDMDSKTGRSQMVIDFTIEAGGKTATYAIPENLSCTYAGTLVLSTDKAGIINELEAVVATADQVIESVPKLKENRDKAKSYLAELNPAYKEKKETEERLTKMENSIGEMKAALEKFISKFDD